MPFESLNAASISVIDTTLSFKVELVGQSFPETNIGFML
jgi:hypothetical protein